MTKRPSSGPACGFTLIELVVVMAMLGLLLALALPNYMASLERGREQVMQHNLATMREAIDKYYGDRGRYPASLDDLVRDRYLRSIPNDPFSGTPTWLVIEHKDPSSGGGVIDVRSTMTDAAGQPRQPIAGAAVPRSDEPSPMVAHLGGARRVVGPDDAASAPPAERAP
jgi:general secretion pathway protein G